GCLPKIWKGPWAPESHVFRIVPFSPTAHPVSWSMNTTDDSDKLTILFCRSQVRPAFDVCRTVPSTPTAHPDCGPEKLTDVRFAVVPLCWCVQVSPPSSVCKIVP